MSSFGLSLREARQKKGVTLDEVTQATRIPGRLLRAIEEESLDDLPGAVYSRAYLRAYAAYVGLDPKGIMAAYETEERAQLADGRLTAEPGVESTMQLMAGRRSSTRLSRRAMAMGLTVVVGLALIGSVALLGEDVAAVMSRWGTEPGSPTGLLASQALPLDTRRVALTVDEHAGVDWLRDTEATETIAKQEVPDSPAPSHLTIARSGVGTDVVGSELVGQADTFQPGTNVAFWTHVIGGQPGDSVRHVWFHENRPVATVTLQVGGPSWRTQSRRTPDSASDGHWAVEAHDESGHILARHEFRTESDVVTSP